MRASLAIVLLLSVGLAGAAHARDSEYKHPSTMVMPNPEFKAKLGDDITLPPSAGSAFNARRQRFGLRWALEKIEVREAAH